VALNFALLFPDQVDALVLVDPVGFGKQGSSLLRMVSLLWVGELFSLPSRKATA
jgi:pimeloyl-ACP methyl ester carboxylesterase